MSEQAEVTKPVVTAIKMDEIDALRVKSTILNIKMLDEQNQKYMLLIEKNTNQMEAMRLQNLAEIHSKYDAKLAEAGLDPQQCIVDSDAGLIGIKQ